jgi:hypothetical protein
MKTHLASRKKSGTGNSVLPFFHQRSAVMNDIERRVAQRARQLWEQAGRPAGGSDPYIDRARELVAIEDRQKQTTKPLAAAERTGPEGEPIATSVGPQGEPIESVEAVENLGEFPTLTDQGEEQQIPQRRKAAPRRRESAGRAARRAASAGTGRAKARGASRPKARKKSTPARWSATRKKARRARRARKRTGGS